MSKYICLFTFFLSFSSISYAQTFDFIDCEGFSPDTNISKIEVKYKLLGHRITPMKIIKTDGSIDKRKDLEWSVDDRIGLVYDKLAQEGSEAKLTIDGTVSDGEPEDGWPSTFEYKGRLVEGFTCKISNFEL